MSTMQKMNELIQSTFSSMQALEEVNRTQAIRIDELEEANHKQGIRITDQDRQIADLRAELLTAHGEAEERMRERDEARVALAHKQRAIDEACWIFHVMYPDDHTSRLVAMFNTLRYQATPTDDTPTESNPSETPNRSAEQAAFKRSLNEASAIVGTWPAWKRDILESVPTHLESEADELEPATNPATNPATVTRSASDGTIARRLVARLAECLGGAVRVKDDYCVPVFETTTANMIRDIAAEARGGGVA